MKHILLLVLAMELCIVSFAQTKRDSQNAMRDYIDENYSKSFPEYQKLSLYGDATDLFNLAEHYYYGLGTVKNMESAMKYYKMSADRGDRGAQARLCEILYNGGSPLESNWKDLYRYGRMYNTSQEYIGSVSSDNDVAGFVLYLCYKNGYGTIQNLKLANIWLAYAAWEDSGYAQDKFCEIHGIDGNYNSDEEEYKLLQTYYKYLYENTSQILENDSTVEATMFRLNYSIITKDWNHVYKYAQIIYNNQKTAKQGKALVLPILLEITKNSGYNVEYEKFKNEKELYLEISEKETDAWLQDQIAKIMWKVDVLLNSQNKKQSVNKEWVDLQLPSGTLWASKNLGAKTSKEIGLLFSWGEGKPKKKFEESNYDGNRDAYIFNYENDPATLSLNKQWSTPTLYQWLELLSYCECTYSPVDNSIRIVSANKAEITLPLTDYSSDIHYWSNSKICPDYIEDTDKDTAFSCKFNSSSECDIVQTYIWAGCPIRPVYYKFNMERYDR